MEMSMAGVLVKILREAHRAKLEGEGFLAVFDLDSTLLDLTKRIREIHLAFARDAQWLVKYPVECAALETVQVSPKDWDIRDGLERTGLFEKERPEFYKDIYAHWHKYFFTNDYLHFDEPLPGAVEFVRALEDEDATIMYLTAREVSRAEPGTRKQLKALGFPLDEEHVELVLKPHDDIDDADFKAMVIADAAEEFDHVWLFENEPVNLNRVQASSPEVNLVFIETTHSGREEVSAELARIPHFEVDLKAFQEFKQSHSN
jgi:hypothetical protein